ncbi:hypothetical protein PENTCL1PPCAC_12174, partial [Pristionchus entomophagus]
SLPISSSGSTLSSPVMRLLSHFRLSSRSWSSSTTSQRSPTCAHCVCTGSCMACFSILTRCWETRRRFKSASS